MKTFRQKKMVHEGEYAAEIEVELVDTGDGWSPYLSLDESYRLDDVRAALRCGDWQAAARQARVYRLIPIEAA